MEPPTVHDSWLGMESLHTTLGTEPASGVRLGPAHRDYLGELRLLAEAIGLEREAVLLGRPPTYRLSIARRRSKDAMTCYRNDLARQERQEQERLNSRGLSPQDLPEETA